MGSARLARLARLVGGLGVVLLLAGCVSMSDGGPPSQYAVNQNDTGQGQDFVGPIPAGPLPGASPAQIVQGFLFASASYFTVPGVAKEFLTPAAQRTWAPDGSVTVFSTWNADFPSPQYSHSNTQAAVMIDGSVQARLNGVGQQLYASAQGNTASTQPTQSGGSCPASSAGSSACYTFQLVKSGGQWRIQTAPDYLMVWHTDFQRAWATQDLYFFDAGRKVLVPDSVFVPIGTSEGELLSTLATALRQGPGSASWLSGAIGANVFPPGISVTVQLPNTPQTPTVTLKGALTSAEQADLPRMAAELVWTLTSASVNQTQVQSVQLQVNGSEYDSQPLVRQMYESYDAYPSNGGTFTYVNQQGEPESRCGSIQNGAVGQPIPVFDAHGDAVKPQCASSSASAAATPSATATQSGPSSRQSGKPGSTTGQQGRHGPASKPAKPATYSMVAVSPRGDYVAVVSAAHNTVSIGSFGQHLRLVFGPQPDITSISWDRNDDLWLSQDGNVWVVTANGGETQIKNLPDVTALSVAPDGVRMALLLQQQSDSGSDLELVAINPGNQSQQQVPRASGTGPSVGTSSVALGPGSTGSLALAWYDADDLLVVGPSTPANPSGQLAEVPVDGRAGSSLPVPQTPAGVTVHSIAADNSANMLVAGLSNGQLEVSAGSQAPWQSVTTGSQGIAYGSQPSYWIPSGS